VIIMYDQRIKLVAVTKNTDEYGDTVETVSEREVFAELRSIGQSEFYQAQALGMKPELKFVLSDYLDYSGEKVLKYQEYGSNKEETYRVIRTFRKGYELEIVCAKGVD